MQNYEGTGGNDIFRQSLPAFHSWITEEKEEKRGMERWVLLRKGADFAGIGERFHISPRLACLIRNRDVTGDEAVGKFLNGTAADLYDGRKMKGMEEAVRILRRKIDSGKNHLICREHHLLRHKIVVYRVHQKIV